MTGTSLPSLTPHIRLFGTIEENTLSEFLRQQAEARDGTDPVVFELSTSGGDADIGRRIAEELRLWQEKEGRTVFFLGKTYLYSAGITVMAAVPQSHRFLTHDCELLIHERKMQQDLKLNGALRSCRSVVEDALAQIDSGQRIERDGFAQLVKGTSLTLEDVQKKILNKDWYLTASQAKDLRLIADVI
jgi:ATP-dependent protease ClpP protease subunit